MPRRKNVDHLILKVRKGATRKEIYAAAREQLTAEELQRLTDPDLPMVPADQVLAECIAINEREKARLLKRKKRKSAK
jgi:hypothetical protein